jgi:hypothetical protein
MRKPCGVYGEVIVTSLMDISIPILTNTRKTRELGTIGPIVNSATAYKRFRGLHQIAS